MIDIDNHETPSGPMGETPDPSPPLVSLARQAILPARRTPSPCIVPDVVGLDALDGHGVVRDAGVRLSVSVWETKVGPWGMILVQRPSPGVRVKSGSRVHVVVSGRPSARVPDVRGLPIEEAVELMRRMGLLAIVAEGQASRSMPERHVVGSIRPTAGTLVEDGSVVAITIAPAGLATPDASADVLPLTPR